MRSDENSSPILEHSSIPAFQTGPMVNGLVAASKASAKASEGSLLDTACRPAKPFAEPRGTTQAGSGGPELQLWLVANLARVESRRRLAKRRVVQRWQAHLFHIGRR